MTTLQLIAAGGLVFGLGMIAGAMLRSQSAQDQIRVQRNNLDFKDGEIEWLRKQLRAKA